MKKSILPILILIFSIIAIWFMVETGKANTVAKCDRDEILFNRTTQVIDGSCYVLMDDGVWLPQMIYWFDHYVK